MHKNIPIIVGITILFLGLAIQPSVAIVQPETEIEIEPKDYLFQTIIDMENNPDVKNLLERYKYDLFKVNIDRSYYHKLLFRNPILLRSLIFSKPSLTFEYLDKCFNKGSEVTKIIGEDKAFDMIESIRIYNPKVFYEIKNIFTRNEELSNRISALQVLNKDSIICDILMLIGYPIGWLFTLMAIIIGRNEVNPIRFTIFRIIGIPINIMMVCIVLLLEYLQCLEFPP